MPFFELEKLKSLVKTTASEVLLKDFGRTEYGYKEDGSVITPADIEMQNRLQEILNYHWPEYAVLGEEMPQVEQETVIANAMANKGYGYWCIDPLDGTSNYTSGVPFYSVSVALIVDNKQQLGLIYDPVRDEMFSAIAGQGAFLNERKIGGTGSSPSDWIAKNKPIVAEIDLKRLPEKLAVKLVTEGIFASQRNMGSSALDWCWLAARRFDVFLHGGHKLWDYAAGSLIFREAGGRSISLDDEAVFRGRLESRSVLASYDPDLFEQWYQWIGIAGGLDGLSV